MEYALQEVKTQARKLLKAFKSEPNLVKGMQIPIKKIAASSLEELKLKHCLGLVAMELGFRDWHEAQQLLSGAKPSLVTINMGSFFTLKAVADLLMSGLPITHKLETPCLTVRRQNGYCPIEINLLW